MFGLQWYELESKGGAFGLWLLMPGLVSPSLDTSLLLISELGCNSKLDDVLAFVSDKDGAGREIRNCQVQSKEFPFRGAHQNGGRAPISF